MGAMDFLNRAVNTIGDGLAQAGTSIGQKLQEIGLSAPASVPREVPKPTNKEVVGLTMENDPASKKAFEQIAAKINENLPNLPTKITPEMVALTIREARENPEAAAKSPLNQVIALAAAELPMDTKMGIGMKIGDSYSPTDILANRMGGQAAQETARREKYDAAPPTNEPSPMIVQGTGRLTSIVADPNTRVTPIDPTTGQVLASVPANQLGQNPSLEGPSTPSIQNAALQQSGMTMKGPSPGGMA